MCIGFIDIGLRVSYIVMVYRIWGVSPLIYKLLNASQAIHI